jgi:protein TonB
MGIGAVVIFHAALIWALAAGLAHKIISVLPPPIETKIIEEIKPPDELPPPPPPPPTMDVPPPFVPPPEINIATPAPQHAITVQDKAPVAKPKAPPTIALKVSGRGCRPPEYPAISNRLGEKGSVVLQMLVGPNGKVTDSKIQTSSGYPRLDEAARRALSLCKFEPAIVGGVPTSAWGVLKYTFRPAN